jgi:hypothetical protein
MFDGGQVKNKNFAPVEPLRHLQDRLSDRPYEYSSFASMIREFHMEISARHKDEREEIAESGRRMANVRSGKLLLKRDPLYGGLALVKPLPMRPREDRHVYPLAQTNSSQLTSIWSLSQPRIIPRHFGNTPKAQIQHAIIEQIIAQYGAEHLDEYFNQRESLSMMDYGTVLIRVFYDQRLNTLVGMKPVIDDVNKTLFEGYQACRNCPHEGKPGDYALKGEAMPRCPDCGSYDITDPLDAVSVQAKQVVGQEEIYQGDIACEMLDVPACNWDMRRLAQDSDFFQFRSEVPVKMIRAMLGIDVPESGPEDDFGLSVLNALGTRGGSTEGYGRENAFGNASFSTNRAIMDEDYFDPSWYSGCRLSKPEIIVGGGEIPAGVPLEEVFPDGICAVGFSDMAILVGAFNEKRRIIGSVYHIQSSSGVGKGTTDAVEIYEQLNSAHSANLAVVKRYGAGGGLAYDKEAVTPKEAAKIMKPGGLAGVKMRSTRYNSVENAFAQIETGQLSQANLTMVAQLANLMNIAFQTTEFTSGLINDNIDINTARGQEMLAAQNQQRSAAPLRMKGYSRARVFEELLDLYREHGQLPRYIGRSDKFALSRGRMVAGADLPKNIKCDFAVDTEIPINRYTKNQNAQNMLEKSQFFGVPFTQLVQMNPRMATWWASSFQADIPLFNEQEILIVCQDRIDNLKEIIPMVEEQIQLSGMQAPPEQLAEQLLDELKREVFVDEENHVLKAEILAEYLDDDEVIEWSPLLKAAVQALIRRHRKYDRDSKLFTAKLMAEGQSEIEQQAAAPMMQAQAAAAQAAAEQASKEAAMEQMAELAKEEEAHARDQEAADMQFSRDQRAADLQAMRDEELAESEFKRDRKAAAEDHTRAKELKKYERSSSNRKPSSGKRA